MSKRGELTVDLRHLAGFVALAEELHFGRAGRRVDVSQSALSRQLRSLEQELGVELFVRSPQRVELTAAGEALLVHARPALAQVRAGTQAARRAGGQAGALRVGHTDWTEQLLPPILRSFRRRCGQAGVALHPVDTPSQASRLRNWGIDVATSRTPGDDADLEHRVVIDEPMLVALPNDHPLAKHERVGVGDLAASPFVLFPRDLCPCAHDLILATCEDAGFVPELGAEAPALTSVTLLVASGMGVSLVPASASLRLRTRDIVYRPIDGPAVCLPLVVTWRRADASDSVREFVRAAGNLTIAKVA